MKRTMRKSLVIALLMIMPFLLLLTYQAPEGNHAIEGGCAARNTPFGEPKTPAADSRSSYCDSGDAFKTVIRTNAFPAGTTRITLAISGYPANPGLKLEAVSADGTAHGNVAVPNAGDRWTTISFDVPAEVKDVPFHLVLTDDAEAVHGWAGMSTPVQLDALSMLYRYARLVFLPLVATLWLAAVSLTLPSRMVSTVSRPIGALIILGILSCITFYTYVFSNKLGKGFSILFLSAPFIAAFALSLKGKLSRHFLQKVLTQQAPVLIFTMLILWIGLHPFTWDGTQWETPMNRWRSMPPDNFIPMLFADMLKQGRIISPMLGDWLSSDRPPLQTGMFLMLAPIKAGVTGTLAYQAVATWIQALIVLPLGCLLAHPSLKRIRIPLLVAVMFSALVILNSLFVWPKLIAATYSLIYFVSLFQSGKYRCSWIIAGISAALALLSHGGSLFILMGISLTYLLSRHRSLTRLAKIAAISFALYAPWIAYQKLVDPPGDRLIKQHLAGIIQVTNESVLSSLGQAYANISASAWLEGRLHNLNIHVFGMVDVLTEAFVAVFSPSTDSIRTVIEKSFFYPSYSTWFASLLIAAPAVLLALVFRREPFRLPRHALPMLGSLLLTALCYSLLMFVPGSTIIHQGSYLYPIFLTIVALAGMGLLSHHLCWLAAMMNVAVAIACYIVPGHASDIPYLAGSVAFMLALMISLTRRKAGPPLQS